MPLNVASGRMFPLARGPASQDWAAPSKLADAPTSMPISARSEVSPSSAVAPATSSGTVTSATARRRIAGRSAAGNRPSSPDSPRTYGASPPSRITTAGSERAVARATSPSDGALIARASTSQKPAARARYRNSPPTRKDQARARAPVMLRSGCGDALEHLGVRVEVRVHRGHVVVVLELLDQPQELAGGRFVDLDAGRRAHRQLGGLELDPRALERLADGCEVARGRHDLPDALVVGDVLRAGLDRGHQVVLAEALGVDHDDALLLELPRDGAGLAQVAAALSEDVPHLGAGAVAVVGERLDEQRDAARAVALVHHGLDLLGVGARAGPLRDRALDVVLRHARVLRLLHGVRERCVHLGVAAALARGNLDRPGQL